MFFGLWLLVGLTERWTGWVNSCMNVRWMDDVCLPSQGIELSSPLCLSVPWRTHGRHPTLQPSGRGRERERGIERGREREREKLHYFIFTLFLIFKMTCQTSSPTTLNWLINNMGILQIENQQHISLYHILQFHESAYNIQTKSEKGSKRDDEWHTA